MSVKISAPACRPVHRSFNEDGSLDVGRDKSLLLIPAIDEGQIAIYDIMGKLITTLFNGEQTSGWHSVIWNGTNQIGEQAPAGLYFSRITSGNQVKTSKLMLLK